MAPASALFGQPPANHHDYLIIKALLTFAGAIGLLDPSQGIPVALAHDTSTGPARLEDRGPDIVVGNVLGIFLVVMCTGLRLSVRMNTSRLHIGWDDWAIIVACFFAVAHMSLVIVAAAIGGLGKHVGNITYEEFNIYSLTSPPRQLTFFLTVATAKMSIALFYMRLNGFTSKKWMMAHWLIFASVVALAIASLFIWIFICDDVSSYWYPIHNAFRTDRPQCINILAVLIALNVWHIITDALLLIVPVVMLWQVRMKLATKFRVWIAGIVGCVNIAIAIVWTITNNSVQGDQTWGYVSVQNWGTAELVIGVITASLPVLSSLVSKMGSRFSRAVSESRLGRSSYFEKAKRVVRVKPSNSIKLDDSIMLTGPVTVTEAVIEVQDDPQMTRRYKEEFEGTNVEQIEVGPDGKSLDAESSGDDRKQGNRDIGNGI